VIPLAKYGLREMLIATGVCGMLTVGCVLTFAPAAVAPIGLWAAVLLFFRDPPRRSSAENVLLSPADGTVTDITALSADSELGVEGVRIGIFMSVLNVHVNRSPFDAEVESVTHREGGFLDARDSRAGDTNESATIRLRCRWGRREFPLIVRQVAGKIARRIVTDLTVGELISAGQRIGMIKFGSRVELWAPKEVAENVAVSVGDKVRAGTTILAVLPEPTSKQEST